MQHEIRLLLTTVDPASMSFKPFRRLLEQQMKIPPFSLDADANFIKSEIAKQLKG